MQDTPSPGSQRGAIRPPSREDAYSERPAARPPVRRPGSMDGVVKVAKPEVTSVIQDAPAPDVAPVVTAAPVAPVAPATPPAAAPKQVPVPPKAKVELPAVEPDKTPRKSFGSKGRLDRKKFFLIALALIVLGVAAYVAYDTYMTNARAESVLKATSNTATETSEWSKDDEGKDESDIPANALANYTVEASLPRALYIDKLDVAARIMPMATNTDGSVQAPKNIFDSGWYNGSVKPGETGAMFIDGHASGATREGLFAYLDTLKKGDTVQVEKGDGEKLSYKVVHTETVALADVDMRKVLLPYENGTKALNLMTCTGKWLPQEKTYDHRVIVYTEQI